MTSSVETGWLPDVNVWIAITSDRHEHHGPASRWFSSNVAPVYFCRVTQMALFRLLANPKIMAGDALSPAHVTAIYRQLAGAGGAGFESGLAVSLSELFSVFPHAGGGATRHQ